MPEPTIMKAGRFEFAMVQMNGFTDRLGVREGPHLPWFMLGDPASVLFSLYYPTVTAPQEWVDVQALPGAVANGIAVLDGFVASSRSKGAPYRSSAPTANGKPRDILTGNGQSYEINVGLPDLQEISAFLLSIIQNLTSLDEWVRVDADSSEMSKGVDYGRAE